MPRPNSLRIEKTPQGRLRVTVLSDSERDISAVIDPQELLGAYEEAMEMGEGPLIHGEHEDEVEA
jgi:hypothetical protein